MKIPFGYTANGNLNKQGVQILEWYRKGYSLRKISKMVENEFGYRFSHMAIRDFLIKEKVYKTKDV